MGIAAHLVQHFELFKSDGHIKVELDLTLIDLTHLMESRRIMRRKLASPISTNKKMNGYFCVCLPMFIVSYRPFPIGASLAGSASSESATGSACCHCGCRCRRFSSLAVATVQNRTPPSFVHFFPASGKNTAIYRDLARYDVLI